MPSSAQVVPEVVERRGAQLLSEVGVLLLFGRQNLLQRADLLLQLDGKGKRQSGP